MNEQPKIVLKDSKLRLVDANEQGSLADLIADAGTEFPDYAIER